MLSNWQRLWRPSLSTGDRLIIIVVASSGCCRYHNDTTTTMLNCDKINFQLDCIRVRPRGCLASVSLAASLGVCVCVCVDDNETIDNNIFCCRNSCANSRASSILLLGCKALTSQQNVNENVPAIARVATPFPGIAVAPGYRKISTTARPTATTPSPH